MYKNTELKKALILKEIENYNHLISMKQKIIEVFNKFDGKVYNVRFKKALEDATSLSVSIKSRYDNNELVFYFYNNRYVSIEADGYREGDYIQTDYAHILTMYDYGNDNHHVSNFINEDNRIIASGYIEAFERWINDRESRNQETLDGLKSLETYIKQHDEIIEKARQYNASVPLTVRDYFDLYINIR